jgi:hypothetical protein
VNDELERIWKWPWPNIKVLYQNSPGATEKKHKNLGQNSWFPGQDLNLGPPKYERRVLTPQLWRLVV